MENTRFVLYVYGSEITSSILQQEKMEKIDNGNFNGVYQNRIFKAAMPVQISWLNTYLKEEKRVKVNLVVDVISLVGDKNSNDQNIKVNFLRVDLYSVYDIDFKKLLDALQTSQSKLISFVRHLL